MKYKLLIVILLIGLVACGSNNVGNEEPPEPEPAVDPLATRADVTPTSEPAIVPADPTDEPEGYPAGLPTATLPAGYPEAPPEDTSPDAYPANVDGDGGGDDEGGETSGMIWILRPVARQCEEEDSMPYATLDDAVLAVQSAGVTVFDSEMVGLFVCEACGCPTSDHFRLQIMAGDYTLVEGMGWLQE